MIWAIVSIAQIAWIGLRARRCRARTPGCWGRSSPRLCFVTASCSLPQRGRGRAAIRTRRNQWSGSSSVKALGGPSWPVRRWPAQQPVLAVGQDAHAHAALLFRLRQVIVELLDVLGIGVEAACGADLRLNSINVSRAARSTARREPSAGGFSSSISSSYTRPVTVRKLRTAVVMLASARLCRAGGESRLRTACTWDRSYRCAWTFGHLSRICGRVGVDGVRGQQYWLTIMVAHSLW